jgi:Tfp pilus assembly PilM family ATPase
MIPSMNPTKGRMLAIEFSAREIRVVEFVPNTRPVQVTNAAATSRPSGEPNVIGKFLREFLDAHGFVAKRALVSYSGPVIEHRIYAIPPVAAESREELLRGKVAQEITTPIGEMRVTGEFLGKTVEQNVERHEILTAFMPEFEVKRLIFMLVEAGVSPARVATVPLALATLHPAEAKDNLAGFLHAESTRCVIGVSNGGKLRFAREFPVEIQAAQPAAPPPEVPDYGNVDLGGEGPSPAEPAAPPAPVVSHEDEVTAERLVTELTRSLLYFRQLSRGGSITKLYWSGVRFTPTIERLISERLKFTIEIHPAAAASVGLDRFEASPDEFGVPIGLAVAMQTADQINLLPEEYLRRRKRRKSYAALVAAGVLFVAANVALYTGFLNAQSRYRVLLAQSESGRGRNAGMEEDFIRWSELRKSASDVAAAEKELATPFTRWNGLFAAMGASAPKEVSFSVLSLERSGNGYAGTLRGLSRGKDPAQVQARLGEFLAGIRRQAPMLGMAYAPVEIRPVRKEEGKGYEQEFLVSFTLAGEG